MAFSLSVLSRRCADVVRFIAHERKDDAGELVGGRHGDELEGLGLHQAIRPASQRIAAPSAVEENGVRADDEQLAQIAVGPSWRRAPAVPCRLRSSAAV